MVDNHSTKPNPKRAKFKVLVGVATYPNDEYPVHPYTADCLSKLLPPKYGTLEIKYYGDDNPELSHRENLRDKHNRMKQDVIEGGYHYLLTVEADMVFEPEALRTLISRDVDVAYGLYVARTKPKMWLCFPDVSTPSFSSLTADPETAVSFWGQTIPSQGAGFGFTLLNRNVCEYVVFRVEEKGNLADDIMFARDVASAGFQSLHDLSVVCGHISGERVFYPFPDEEMLFIEYPLPDEYLMKKMSYEAGLYTVLRPISQRGSKGLRPGDQAEFEGETARILLSKGAIKPITEEN